MDRHSVRLVFSLEENATPIGNLLKLKPFTFTAKNRKYKAEYDEYRKTLESINFRDIINHNYMPDGIVEFDGASEVVFNFLGYNGKEKTFRFLGMDVTNDLLAVIKGSYGSIIVAGLYMPNALIDTDTYVNSSTGAEEFLRGGIVDTFGIDKIENILNKVTKEDIKASIENLKFSNLSNIEESLNIAPEINFLDNLTQKFLIDSEYSSIVLQFINSKMDNPIDLSEKELQRVFYTLFGRYWKDVVSVYKVYSVLLSLIDKFLDLHKKLVGADDTEFYLKQNVFARMSKAEVDKDYGIFGNFEGYSQGELYSRNFDCDMASDFLRVLPEKGADDTIGLSSYTRTYGESLSYPLEMYMATMFEHDSDFDITSLSKQEMTALSVLDGVKYLDDDLELEPNLYDMKNEDERELFLKTAIVSYKKKFETYLRDENFNSNIDDAVISNILPKDESSIDILGLNDPNQIKKMDTDSYISQVSFDKTNLLKACRLIKKLSKMISNNFAEVEK